jgi:PPM family protein phosphatase
MSQAARDGSLVITSVYACSDIGNVRANNEDNFVISDLKDGRACAAPQTIRRALDDNHVLIAVSDGMGGAQAGEIASALAVYGLRLELLRRLADAAIDKTDSVSLLTASLEKINDLIWQAGQRNPAFKGMGAAITAAIIEGARVYVAEVGDSRAYVIRGSRIKQITTDQSLFEALMSSGVFKTSQMGENAPSRNIILQSLGGQQSVEVAVTALDLQAGDFLLLCSDGLSNKLTAEEIRQCINQSANLETACANMIAAAKKRGGEDNITVVLASFEGDCLPFDSDQYSITQSIDVISDFNPMKDEVPPSREHRTQQMVSNQQLEEAEAEEPDAIFRSTIGLLPPSEYPSRSYAIAASDRSIESIQTAGEHINAVIEQVRRLDDWLMKQGRLDPALQKAIVHLEHAINNLQKIESVTRRARNCIERASAKPDSTNQ